MKHYIIVKFIDSENIQELIEPIQELFNKALNIDGVNEIKVYKSNMNLHNRHDVMIKMVLTPEALTKFDSSEIHKQWKLEYGKYILDKTIFDCD